MRRAEQWKPHRSLAALLGVLGAVLALVVDIGSDRAFGDSLVRAFLASAAGAAVGFLTGKILWAVLAEIPDPEPPISAGDETTTPGRTGSDGNGESGPGKEETGDSVETAGKENKRKDEMVSNTMG